MTTSLGPAAMKVSTIWESGLLDPALAAALRNGLAEVETVLRDIVRSDYAFLHEISRHLLLSGGKRVRPTLCLLAGSYGDPGAAEVVQGAVMCELTHLATLYHDDVMDEARMRRSVPSANARWDNSVAVLTGDFILGKAAAIAADLGPETVRCQALTAQLLVSGQIRETVGAAPGEDPVEHYWKVVAEKTASLIATSGRLGAFLSGAEPAVTDLVERFCERIGTAFQLADDLLDITASVTLSGKIPGTDLREGIETLPVLYARRHARPGDERLIELLDGDLTEDTAVEEALDLLRDHPGTKLAHEELRDMIRTSAELLDGLPDIPATKALRLLCRTMAAGPVPR